MGIWYTFVSVYTIIVLIDFGFAPVLIRSLTYAWSGVSELKAKGVADVIQDGHKPNIHLFSTVFLAARILCFILSLAVLLLMITCGTAYIRYISNGLTNKSILAAWILYSIGGWANIYFNYLILGLKSVGAVAGSQQAVAASKIVQLIISAAGVASGGGLAALSVSYVISGLVMRIMAKNIFYKYMGIGGYLKKETKNVTRDEIVKIFKIIWVNAKKVGCVVIASTIMVQSGVLFCSAFIGIKETAVYGLCVQLNTVLFSMGQIFYQTNVAALTNAKINKDKQNQQKIFSTAIVLSWCIVAAGIIFLSFLGDWLLNLIGTNTQLQIPVLIFVWLYMLLEQNSALSTHYISLNNTYPFMRSLAVTAAFQLLALSGLAVCTKLQVWHILLINIVSRSFYISWKWPAECLKELRLTVFQLIRFGFLNILLIIRSSIFRGKNNEYANI
jgi:O-antigen/teichoic acid export membrane protein